MTADANVAGNQRLSLIDEAFRLPNGGRFYRCALQVKPHAYVKRQRKQTEFKSEDEYNKAIVAACHKAGVEVIALTGHYDVQSSVSLLKKARDSGLHAFIGFEAITNDGVHFLCLFDPGKDGDTKVINRIDRFITFCEVENPESSSPSGRISSSVLLERAKEWNSFIIAAHVTHEGGLLATLSGKPRIKLWTHEALQACALPGSVRETLDKFRLILENKDANHKRSRMPVILNASNVCGPVDLNDKSTSCFIKMSEVSVEALRHAFLDPGSRVRLNSDPEPGPHSELQAIAWEGGFLDGTAVHLNENLNVLVGGRGTGKSTMIESIRYVLGIEPIGEEAIRTHRGVIANVLQAGTKITLRVQSKTPDVRCYTIERTVPNPPIVIDNSGEVLDISPLDVMPGVEVYGQHEISELTTSETNLTSLLERFADRDPLMSRQKAQIQKELEESRRRIMGLQPMKQRLEERLEVLPSLEETQKRYKLAGLEDRLKNKSSLVREERIFVELEERYKDFQIIKSELDERLPVDSVFVSSKALARLPNAEILGDIEKFLGSLSKQLMEVSKNLNKVLDEADSKIEEVKTRWDVRRNVIEENYERLLRTLQKSSVDGAEFIRLRQQIEALRPHKRSIDSLNRFLNEHIKHRKRLLREWEDIKASDYRRYKDAAVEVTRRLTGRVQAKVTIAGDRKPLEDLLRENVGGILTPALDRLLKKDQLSLTDFAQSCREGKKSLMKKYKLPPGAADRIAQAGLELSMMIEELELPATTAIKLNTAAEQGTHVWQSLDSLSTGQKATALLFILLLGSEAPLVIDQPEDDLDNRFITEGVVPIMRQEKRNRQFVFSTHNANIPVLGDAELILGLATSSKEKQQISREHMGSIDSQPVRELVEDILEGGKEAFETRRSKYGF